MHKAIGWFLGIAGAAAILLGATSLHKAVELGSLDHIEMKIQLAPVITFAKQAYDEPVLHVRLDAAVKVPLSVWLKKDISEVKIREAMAFTIRNTPRNELGSTFSDSLLRHIKTRAKEMHGIKILDFEVSRYTTAG